MLLPDLTGGGAERVALSLIGHWVSAGYEVDLLLVRARGDLLPLVPPEVNIVDLQAERMRSAFRPLVRYLRERRPDALQASMWPTPALAIAARRVAGVPTRLVLSEHTTLSKHYAGRGRLHSFLLRKSIRWLYPKAQARIAVSHNAADDLAKLSGLDRKSIEVVYNPVAAPAGEPMPAGAADALWQVAEGRILSVGRMTAEKNHILLLRAFAEIRRRRPARLMLLGQGPLREHLERVAKELGISEDVMFPGFVLDPQPYYASANVFALSSDFEGYPLVLVEALRNGLPIVSTDCMSGPREILDGGRYGTLVPCGDENALADALEAALAAPPLPGDLRARADELGGEAIFSRYLALMTGDAA